MELSTIRTIGRAFARAARVTWGRRERPNRVRVKTFRLVGLNFRQRIDYSTTELQISRSAPLPSPLLERARRHQPAFSQGFLVNMRHLNTALLRNARCCTTTRLTTLKNVHSSDREVCGQQPKKLGPPELPKYLF